METGESLSHYKEALRQEADTLNVRCVHNIKEREDKLIRHLEKVIDQMERRRNELDIFKKSLQK